MEINLYTILKNNSKIPRVTLEADIVGKIYAYETRRKSIKLWSYILLGVVSLAGVVPAIADVSSRFRESGFYEYLSLVFSNGGSLSNYGQDFAMALGESIPVFSIIVFLIVLFVLLWSVRNIFRQSSIPHFRLSVN